MGVKLGLTLRMDGGRW